MTIWPFKRKYPDINALPPVSLDGDNNWGVAQTDDDGSPLIVRYNQAARDWCGHPKLPVKLGFAIPLNRTNEGGLPDSDENRQLNEIEDLLLREIDGRTRAMHALDSNDRKNEGIRLLRPARHRHQIATRNDPFGCRDP